MACAADFLTITQGTEQRVQQWCQQPSGFAITRLDEESALETLKLFEEMGALEEELNPEAPQHVADPSDT